MRYDEDKFLVSAYDENGNFDIDSLTSRGCDIVNIESPYQNIVRITVKKPPCLPELK